jgi:hypothetical protein
MIKFLPTSCEFCKTSCKTETTLDAETLSRQRSRSQDNALEKGTDLEGAAIAACDWMYISTRKETLGAFRKHE